MSVVVVQTSWQRVQLVSWREAGGVPARAAGHQAGSGHPGSRLRRAAPGPDDQPCDGE